MLVDYSYYINTYKGDLVPNNKFNKCSQIAEKEVINSILGKDYSSYEAEVKNTVCEVLEIIYNQELIKSKTSNIVAGNDQLLSSEKVGDYSRSYSGVSINDLKTLSSDETTKVEINSAIERNLLLTGLLYRGVAGV